VLLLYTGNPPFSPIFFCLPSMLLIDKDELTKPISFRIAKWNGKAFTSGLFVVLGMILIMMIIISLGEEGWLKLISKGYFAFTLWLLCITGLSRRYIQEKQKAQPAK